jgi:hypothetical protein
MSPRAARAIATLYAKRWQARYGDEFVALLEAMPATPAVVLDACLPAIARHARRATIAIAVAVSIAFPVTAALRSASAQNAAFHPRDYFVAQTVCRPHPKLTRSAFAGWHRCLD